MPRPPVAHRPVRRVLVVSHEASRTGAPRVAIEILRSLEPLGVRRLAVLRWGGPLAAEFAAHADRVSLEPLRRLRVLLRRWRRTRAVANRLEQLAAALVLLRHRPHAVYLNTVKSACYIRPALLMLRPVVLHVHELEPLASHTLARYRLAGRYEEIHLAACGAEVRETLSRITGVATERIALVESAVDPVRVTSLAAAGPPGGWPAGGRTLVVGACGTADEGKGVDQWLSMAKAVLARTTDLGIEVRFVWVGRPQVEDLPDLLRRLGLADAVKFTGEMANPYPVMAALDVFTHPARQDSFPLAVLEAMVLGRPVVAFDVGGVGRQLGGAGMIVPAGDVLAMAEAVLRLAGDPSLRRDLGSRAAERASLLFSVGRQHEAIRAVVGELLDGKRNPLG